jgi:hypothetical protein
MMARSGSLRFAFALVLALSSAMLPVSAGEGGRQSKPSGAWTAIIPDAYPNYVYTWRFAPDGTYTEDGSDLSGASIQPMQSGHWSLDGARMIMRQDTDTFVFDGVLAGKRYWGTLTLDGREISKFCAAKGEDPPEHCDEGEVSMR